MPATIINLADRRPRASVDARFDAAVDNLIDVLVWAWFGQMRAERRGDKCGGARILKTAQKAIIELTAMGVGQDEIYRKVAEIIASDFARTFGAEQKS